MSDQKPILWRLALLSFASAVIAGAAYILTVSTRSGQLMGELILGGRPASADDVAAAERYLEIVSRTSLVLGTVVVIAIASIQRKPQLALVATMAIIGANVSSQLLKYLILDRSDLLDGLFYPLPNSFPSGRSTAAASIAVALVLVLPPLLRAPVVLLAGAAVALLGVSTVVAGWHRMADAIGGVYLATAWGAGLAAALVWKRGAFRVGHRTAAAGRVAAWLTLLIGLGLTGLGLLGYLIILADPLDVLDYLASRGGSPAAFTVGVLLTIGTSMVALGALGLVLRGVMLDPPGNSAAKPPSEDLGPGRGLQHDAPPGLGSDERRNE